jgi:hypothetical protein
MLPNSELLDIIWGFEILLILIFYYSWLGAKRRTDNLFYS